MRRLSQPLAPDICRSGSSAAEEIAKAASAGAKAVKAFNTTFAGTLLAGPLRRARELEALGFLHMTLQDSLGTGYASTVKFLG